MKRRVNYKYLVRLSERLNNLGHSINDIPREMLINQLWHVHRDYIQTELGLSYCVRCKLPCAPEDMDPKFTNICIEHGDTLRGLNEDREERKLAHRLQKTEARAAGIIRIAAEGPKQISERVQQLFKLKEALQRDGHVAASTIETPSDPQAQDNIGTSVMAILNRKKA